MSLIKAFLISKFVYDKNTNFTIPKDEFTDEENKYLEEKYKAGLDLANSINTMTTRPSSSGKYYTYANILGTLIFVFANLALIILDPYIVEIVGFNFNVWLIAPALILVSGCFAVISMIYAYLLFIVKKHDKSWDTFDYNQQLSDKSYLFNALVEYLCTVDTKNNVIFDFVLSILFNVFFILKGYIFLGFLGIVISITGLFSALCYKKYIIRKFRLYFAASKIQVYEGNELKVYMVHSEHGHALRVFYNPYFNTKLDMEYFTYIENAGKNIYVIIQKSNKIEGQDYFEIVFPKNDFYMNSLSIFLAVSQDYYENDLNIFLDHRFQTLDLKELDMAKGLKYAVIDY